MTIQVPSQLCSSFHNFRPTAYLIILLVIGPAALSFSQTAINRDSITAGQLEEVVITAQGSRRELMNLPVAVSSIGKAEMRIQSGKGLPAVLNMLPGVFAHQGTLNTNRITIRGIGARVPYATGRIRSWLEELPLTNGSGYSMMEYIDPVFIQQIEVMRSPTTLMHGASLGGAVVLGVLDEQTEGVHLSAGLSAGSFGLLKPYLKLHTSNPKHQQRLLISRTRSDGWRENNSADGLFAGYAGKFETGQKHQLKALFVYQQLKAFIPSSIDSATFRDSPRSAATNWKNTKGYEDGTRLIGGLSSIWQARPTLTFKTSVYGHVVSEHELRPFDKFDEDRQLSGLRWSAENTRRIKNSNLKFIGGWEAFAEHVSFVNFRNTDGFGSLGDSISRNHEKIQSLAFFLQTDWLWPKSNLTTGIYLQQLQNRFSNRVVASGQTLAGTYQTGWIASPRLAFNHRLNNNLSLFASFSHGFAPPPLNETLDSEGKLNPEIKPEQSLTFDIGTRLISKRSHFFAEAVFFQMNIRDLLVAERIDADRWIGRNAGKTLHQGLEVTTVLNITDTPYEPLNQLKWKNILTAGNYRFIDFDDRGVNHRGKEVPGIPRLNFRSSIECLFRFGLSLSLMGEYVSRMPLNDANTKYSNAYGLLHFRATWIKTIRKTTTEVFVQANNLTNKPYASMILVNAPGRQNQRYYYPGLPIHFEAGLQLSVRK